MEKAKAIEKLHKQCNALSSLRNGDVGSAQFKKWERDTELAIEYIFGKETRHLQDFNSIRWTPGSWNSLNPDPEWRSAFISGLETADAILQSMIDEINEYWVEDANPEAGRIDQSLPREVTRDVFLVHGRNEACRETVARFIEKLKLTPVILHEQPNKGRTIIEKFVDYSDVSFAVVLLTADDRGGLWDTSFDKQQPRARQNVIIELGFFLGRLGREKVCALYDDGVEIPSDYDGVVFVLFDKAGAWRLHLAREIKEAGLPIDMNDAI